MEEILEEVRRERAYQKAKWSDSYDDRDWTEADWLRLIHEYADNVVVRNIPRTFRERMVKVAALAVAVVETIDNKE